MSARRRFSILIAGFVALGAAGCQTGSGQGSATTPLAPGDTIEAGAVSPGTVDPTPNAIDSTTYTEPLPLRRIPVDIEVGERPPLDTDEAGLWFEMDRVDRSLRGSGKLIRDPELKSYIDDIVCRLAGEYCESVRVYIIQTPYFNATMAPNGTMQVWSGLLLRMQDEAQLSAVLGHEIGHYLRRHSIKRWRQARNLTDGMAFFRIATALAGVGVIGDLAMLGALGSLQSYGRDHEREADFMGQNIMVDAGYDPMAAAEVWEQLVKERTRMEEIDPDKKTARSLFFASHPPSKERAENLRLRAEAFAEGGFVGDRGRDAYIAAIGPWRETFLADELALGEFAQTEALLELLISKRGDDGALRFFKGEFHRARNDEGDLDSAVAAYEEARALGYGSPSLERSLGLVLLKLDRVDEATDALNRYLTAAPDGDDVEMIKFMIDSATGSTS